MIWLLCLCFAGGARLFVTFYVYCCSVFGVVGVLVLGCGGSVFVRLFCFVLCWARACSYMLCECIYRWLVVCLAPVLVALCCACVCWWRICWLLLLWCVGID